MSLSMKEGRCCLDGFLLGMTTEDSSEMCVVTEGVLDSRSSAVS